MLRTVAAVLAALVSVQAIAVVGTRLLEAVKVHLAEKKAGLARTVKDALPAVDNFLQALIERHRMPAIYRIRTEFEVLYDKTNKLLPVRGSKATKRQKSN